MNVEVTAIDSVNHSYFVKTNEKIHVLQCWQLEDASTATEQNIVERIVGNTVTEDICFTLEARSLCPDKSWRLRDTLEISSQPPLPETIMQSIVTKKVSDTKFRVCIPASTIESDHMPKDFPMSLIVSASWTTDSAEEIQDVAWLSLVYDITLISEIVPELKSLKNVVNARQHEPLLIDARGSKFAAADNKQGGSLTYRWECSNNI